MNSVMSLELVLRCGRIDDTISAGYETIFRILSTSSALTSSYKTGSRDIDQVSDDTTDLPPSLPPLLMPPLVR